VSLEETIKNRVIDVAAGQAMMPREKISGASHFVEELGFDSLDLVELLMGVEDEFELEIADEDAEKCLTIDDAAALVQRCLAGSAA